MTGIQQKIWDDSQRDVPQFDGADYNHELDHVRLKGQIKRIFLFMKFGAWHTLQQIAAATGDPEASVSAQLRNLRKDRFGGHTVEKERTGNPEHGHYRYRLIVNENAKIKLDG